MTKGTQPIFAEDSDEGSINTITTAASENDPDREYAVEKILAEQLSADGKTMHYLLKWEGYPLYRCTWETKENISHDILLREWDTEKRLARQGKKTLFNVAEYDKEFEDWADGRERRGRLREKKRQKRRGMVLQDEESDFEDEFPTTETPKRSRVKTSPVKRKGVALPVKKNRSTFPNVADEIDESAVESDADSLFEERSKSVSAQASPKRRKSSPASSISRPKEPKAGGPTGSLSTSKSPDPPPLQRKSNTATTTEQRKPVLSAAKVGVSSTAARKSAPAPSSTQATAGRRPSASNVFAGDWTQGRKKKQRVRVSGETPKDSTDPKFTRLSIQNRYQKYSKNEPAPDPSSLATVDPKTGRIQPPKISTAKVGGGGGEIHSAYGRRTPPPTSKRRSPRPSSPQLVRQSEGQVRTEQPPLPSTAASTSGASYPYVPGRPSHFGNRKLITCYHWQEGDCRYTAETCHFAHGYPEQAKKKNITCYYWYNGNKCRKSAEQCDFAHENTGEYAGPPGSFRRRSMGVNAIKESDLRLVREISSPTTEEAIATFAEPASFAPQQINPGTPVRPLEVFEGEQIATTAPVPVVTDPRLRGRNPHTAVANNLPDPRLRGRTSLATETGATSPPEPKLATRKEVTFEETSEFAIADDSDSAMHGTIEGDLEMAKRGIPELDANRILALNNEKQKEIEHVLIHMPDRPGELKLLTKFFEGLKRKVYNSNSVGAWNYFRKTYGTSFCLVLVHPSELFDGALPGLNSMLVDYGRCRVFSIGVQHEQCIRERREPAYEAQRLFPQGGITFITDDVFVYYPDKATEIIEGFLRETRAKPPGAEMNKIGARPGIKDWLMRLAIEKFEEQGGEGHCTDLRWIDCYEALCRLCPFEHEDPEFANYHVPLESSHLWSIWEESLPSFKGRWESGDEEGATEYMANLFAGEACCKAWKYRKFFFVYQRPGLEEMVTSSQGQPVVQQVVDPKGWSLKYSHINVVTPELYWKTKK